MSQMRESSVVFMPKLGIPSGLCVLWPGWLSVPSTHSSFIDSCAERILDAQLHSNANLLGISPNFDERQGTPPPHP